MQIRCPNCRARVGLDPSKVPSKGAHATCPKCSERMFINREFQTFPVWVKERVPPVSGAVSPPIVSARAADRQSSSAGRPGAAEGAAGTPDDPYAPAGRQYFDESADDVSLVEEPGYYTAWIGWAFVLALVVAAGLAYWGTRPDDVPQDMGEKYYGQFTSDLSVIQVNLRKRFQMSSNHQAYSAGEGSPEMRAITAIMVKCEKGCPKPLRADIFPLMDPAGFRAEVSCGESREHSLEYRWSSAEASVDGQTCP